MNLNRAPLKQSQRRIPPFKALRAFESAARHGSFSLAAEELNVTRAAVSQQIKLLEQYLDSKLFERAGIKLKLTEQALDYLPLLTDTLDNLAFGTNHLFGQKKRETLKIRVAQSFCHMWLLPRLADFHRNYPNIALEFYSTTNLYPSNNNTVDLEIVNGYGNWNATEYETLGRKEEWSVVASPQFLNEHDFALDIEAIALFPKIETLGYNEGWKTWFALHDSSLIYSAPMMQFDSTQLSVEAAIQGLGMLIAKSVLVDDALKQGTLKLAHPRTMPSQSQHYLIKNITHHNAKKINTFREWLAHCDMLLEDRKC
ncbi:LysR substrate-binding domain-containing protein [Vibrio superstes]|uniref:Transcriptional regulator n=1 Tax=Vibrio superstes NBRC 103154 TaxID=1219062 RepID=A0A511QSG8_9VIBR|nr:LysR substrate-binding domain-containing protein [Vibrio superstes]GEM79806.1 transcriptional regulator [Vibrio superstes NBRC 103154]